MSKHTPGPWMVSPYNTMGIFDDKKRPIAVAYEGVHSYDIELPEREANAKLIAAAPEMLEALRACVEWAKAGGGPEPFTAAGRIIAKATGES